MRLGASAFGMIQDLILIKGLMAGDCELARRLQIGVIGGREVAPEILNAAEEVGRQIGRRGAVLICGGMGGVMEAACRGAKEAEGTTVGILPVLSADDGNPHLDVVIPTGMGLARNAIIINSCDGVIAVGGKYGTLSEMAFALQKGVPLVSLESWDFDKSMHSVKSPQEAIECLFRMIEK